MKGKKIKSRKYPRKLNKKDKEMEYKGGKKRKIEDSTQELLPAFK